MVANSENCDGCEMSQLQSVSFEHNQNKLFEGRLRL